MRYFLTDVHAVLDLPQLYQKPSTAVLLSTLTDLSSAPPSWGNTPRFGSPRGPLSGVSTPLLRKRKIRSEGVPRYLTKIIASSLAWIEDDNEKAHIWEAASQRLSERSGRSAMGSITRSFIIPTNPGPGSQTNGKIEGAGVVIDSQSDEAIEIVLHEPGLTADNLGLKTWASSFLLAKRLHSMRSLLPTPSPILELGSGTGLVGLAAAAVFRTNVILTDLGEILPNLERNIHANLFKITAQGGNAEAKVLDWHDPHDFLSQTREQGCPSSFSLILAADPIYSPEHPALFTSAAKQLLHRSKEARLVVELPLREAFAAERQDFHDQMTVVGLEIVDRGEETGYDDWASEGGDEDDLAEVRCSWIVWAWKCAADQQSDVIQQRAEL